jgi:hypothetical protein
VSKPFDEVVNSFDSLQRSEVKSRRAEAKSEATRIILRMLKHLILYCFVVLIGCSHSTPPHSCLEIDGINKRVWTYLNLKGIRHKDDTVTETSAHVYSVVQPFDVIILENGQSVPIQDAIRFMKNHNDGQDVFLDKHGKMSGGIIRTFD